MVSYPSLSSLSGFFHLLSLDIVVHSKPGADLDQNLEVKGKATASIQIFSAFTPQMNSFNSKMLVSHLQTNVTFNTLVAIPSNR